jgi:uncharacterized protein (DUF934 family)/rhodanese-related sulfurtransferase
MPTLIDRTGTLVNRWIQVDTNAAQVPVESPALVPLAVYREDPAGWRARRGDLGVLLSAQDDPLEIADDLERLSLVAVDFPSFTDGRGYSTGRLLRDRYQWRGELRAVGDVLRDQLQLLARCGFDQFALGDGIDINQALAAFSDFDEPYQADALANAPFERRGSDEPQKLAASSPQRQVDRLNMQASQSNIAPRDGDSVEPNPGYAGDVNPGEAWSLMQAGTAQMLDVRTAEELHFVGRVPGALHVPWAIGIGLQRNPDFVEQVLQLAKRDDRLLLLCRSAKRSLSAARALTSAGFTQVYNILEGFEGDMDSNGQRGRVNGWRLHGLPWRQS